MSNNKIAKNTLFLYFRMFAMMFTSLYTSRIVLDALGTSDYGLYNIIGGVIILFTFLNQALSSATQRYLNFYLGRMNLNQVNEVFCMSMNIYIILSFFSIFLAETIGYWFINNYLNIPTDRIPAANWVYQLTIITLIINLIRIPYNASIIAYERMDFYAYISLIEVILKLVVVYLLYISPYDKLITYALLYTIIPLIITFIYHLYCKRKFLTTRYHFSWYTEVFRKLFSFSSWSLFGSIANLTAQQGLNILINIFYGVTVNAAAGIANQVSSNIYQFISNFQIAFNPQIIKTYASKQIVEFHNLIIQTSKYSYYLLFILVLPILITTDSILSIWLTDVPIYTCIFCRLILIFLMIEALSAPLWMAVQATGNIKKYQIIISIIIILNFPISYLILKLGGNVYSIWVIRIVTNTISFIFRCWYLKKQLAFPIISYIRKTIIPIIKVTILALPIPLLVFYFTHLNTFTTLTINIITSFLSGLLCIYSIGISQSEKEQIISLIIKKINTIKKNIK